MFISYFIVNNLKITHTSFAQRSSVLYGSVAQRLNDYMFFKKLNVRKKKYKKLD